MIWLGLYVATIWLANWSLLHLGDCSSRGPCTIPVWPGVSAPSGVLWAGAALTLRDLAQDSLGRRWTVLAILTGAALSALLSGPLALASGTAFLLSESLDFLVYTPLRRRNWLGAVAASNVAGLLADSCAFLLLAFGSLHFLAGQVIGKSEVTLLTVALLWLWRARRTRVAYAR